MCIRDRSKFSKVSIFSELNNLRDISLDVNFSDIVGITQAEVENNFKAHIQKARIALQVDQTNLLEKLKEWYNGYSWDGHTRVYNPWSLMSFFTTQTFRNYWFETGTPTFLIKQIQKHKQVDFEHQWVDESAFMSYDIEACLLYTSPSPRDATLSRMPSSA